MGFHCEEARSTILFDLDGTLLPMDMKEFERAYFGGLCRAIPEMAPQELMKAVWNGVKAMAQNDGSRTNREAFAESYRQAGYDYYGNEERYLEYYRTDFQKCAAVCPVTDVSREIVHTLQDKGYQVAVATNPIFPQIATWSRLAWLGLSAGEFPLVTTFENSHFAKPNPRYYLEVCEKLGVAPKDCVMVGNDVEEDGCAASLGMEVLLVKDWLLNARNLPTEGFQTGTLTDVLEWAKSLPLCKEK